jgi:signal transduction histidine kinase
MRRLGGQASMLRRNVMRHPRPGAWIWFVDVMLAIAVAGGTVTTTLTRGQFSADPLAPAGRPPPPGRPVAPPAPANLLLHHYGPPHAWQVLLAAMVGLPLLLRRRYPLTVLLAVLAADVGYHLSPGFDPTATFAACVIAAYSAVMYSERPRLAITGAVLTVGVLVGGHKANVPEIKPGMTTFVFLVLVAFTATAINGWRQRARTMEAQQSVGTRLAVKLERARIAQELHDVVTHNVSVMVVQAGAARKVMDAAPERAHNALLAVESSGRAAMTELRHAMDVLALNGEEAFDDRPRPELNERPGLDHLEPLAERVRGIGIELELTVTGERVALPPAVDLAAYRVVQEALTNVIKHAHGAGVTVAVRYGRDAVEVAVINTGGRPTPQATTGNGHGLAGLRERIRVHGGTLEAGSLPGGGFRVCATIPLSES